jgi:ketosteroid isomerase-like protein
MSRVGDPILASVDSFMAAFLKNDVATIVSFYCDDAVMMPPNEPTLFGKAELVEWHNEYFSAFRVLTFDRTEREVTMLNDWAIERWSYLVAIQSLDGQDRIRDDGRVLTVWKKEGDRWRIAQTMFNSIRPIGGGTSRFLVRLKKKEGLG